MTMQTVTLAEICKKKHITPKVARNRLRRALAVKHNKVPDTLLGHRWVWPKSKEKEVIPYISD